MEQTGGRGRTLPPAPCGMLSCVAHSSAHGAKTVSTCTGRPEVVVSTSAPLHRIHVHSPFLARPRLPYLPAPTRFSTYAANTMQRGATFGYRRCKSNGCGVCCTSAAHSPCLDAAGAPSPRISFILATLASVSSAFNVSTVVPTQADCSLPPAHRPRAAARIPFRSSFSFAMVTIPQPRFAKPTRRAK